MLRFNLRNNLVVCEYFPFIRGNFGQQTLESEFVGCGCFAPAILTNCRFGTSAEKGNIVKGCSFFKYILNAYGKTGGKNANRKLSYDFMCKKWSHLGAICST